MKAQIKTHNGPPTLFLDDKPAFCSHQWLSNQPGPDGFPAAECVRLFGQAGVHMYALGVCFPDACGHWCGQRPGHTEPYDFSMVEPQLRSILSADPQALFHLRLYFETAEWWNQLHPNECEIASDGRHLNQSYASEVWRQDVKDFLRAYVAHLRSIGLYDRVIAYQVQAGICGEWVKNTTSMQPVCGDFSQPMRRHFRAWLRQQYGANATLQNAWGNPSVTLDTAEVPAAEAQLNSRIGLFRDPARERNVIDYYRCLAELVADDLVEFCQTVKALTNGEALAGAFFGYLMDLAWNDCFFGAGTSGEYSTIQRCGHLGLRKVLQAPEVDYLVSPYGYAFRRQNPNFQPWLEKFQKLGTWAMQLDRRPCSEVAVLVDDESFMYESLRNAIDLPLIFRQRVTSLPRFGAPHDVYLLNDLLDGKLPKYKLYIFLNPFHLNSARRDALKRQIRRDGKVAVWLYAPGYLQEDLHTPGSNGNADPGQLASPRCMTDLTGFRFGKWDYAWGPFMHITDFAHPITQAIPQDLFWGTTAPLGPLFHLEDPDATILGQVVYSLGRCKPGLGVKTFAAQTAGAWTSIYNATPDIPAPLLRGIAHFAGVHLYSDAGDVMHATPDLLGVHTAASGARSFKLPKRAEVVYDLFNDKLIAQDTCEFHVHLPAASTSLYYTGNRAVLMPLNPNLS